ncbi:MAG: peptidase S8, partial [Candidatus Parcubacteria bacterium]|nr:peptidase S8 [Candidatus Parcubacteria bacterium]
EHKEYKDKIENYSEYGESKKEEPSMHGPPVASLLVGETCGVAPGAKLDYRAVPSGREFTYWAKALNDIIEKNKKSEPN